MVSTYAGLFAGPAQLTTGAAVPLVTGTGPGSWAFIAGASVLVIRSGTGHAPTYQDGTPAVLYADPNYQTPLANPMPIAAGYGQAGVDGESNLTFYADTTYTYQAVVAYSGIYVPMTVHLVADGASLQSEVAISTVNVMRYGAGLAATSDDHAAILLAMTAAGWTGSDPTKVQALYFPACPRGYYIDATAAWPNPPNGSPYVIISDPGVIIYKAHNGNLLRAKPNPVNIGLAPVLNPGDLTLTIAGAAWAPNQYQGWQIEVTSAPMGGHVALYQRRCVSNTANTITFESALGMNMVPVPSPANVVNAYLPWQDLRFDGWEVRGLTQTVKVNNATGGTFTLTYNGQTSAPIAYNASAATVQTALQALSTIGAGNISVVFANATYFLTWAVAFYHPIFQLGLDQIVSADPTGLTGPTPPPLPSVAVSGSASNIVIWDSPHISLNVGSRYSMGGDNISVNRCGWVSGGEIKDAYISGAVFCLIVYDCDGIFVLGARPGKWVNGFGGEIKDSRNCWFIAGIADLGGALFGQESVPIGFIITCSGVNQTRNCGIIDCWSINAPLSTPLLGYGSELIALHSEGSYYNAENYQIRGGGVWGCPGGYSVQGSGGALIINATVSDFLARYCTQVGAAITNPGTQISGGAFDHCTLGGIDVLTSDVLVKDTVFRNNNYNPPWTVTAATWSGGQATITLGVFQGHQPPGAFLVGQTVKLSGFTPSGWNGAWVIATVTGQVSGATVTLTMAGNPGAVTALGFVNLFTLGAGIRLLNTFGDVMRTTIDGIEVVHDDPLSATARDVWEVVAANGHQVDYTLVKFARTKDLAGGFVQDHLFAGVHSQAYGLPGESIYAGSPTLVTKVLGTPITLGADPFLPASAQAETFSRRFGADTACVIASGVLVMVAVEMVAGQVVSTIAPETISGLTRGTNGDSHLWYGFFDQNQNLLAVTADDTTTSWTAGQQHPLPVASVAGIPATGYLVPATAIYYVGIVVVPGTGGSPVLPNLAGRNNTLSAASQTPPLTIFGDSGLTVPATFPYQSTQAGGYKGYQPYVVIS